MSTLTTIQAADLITNSRADINNNFSALNSEKIETSVLDTDTTLAANSDAKVATQKAVKAYVDTGGNVNASETNKGIVEEATDAEVTAGTATGGTSAKLFITPAKLLTYLSSLLSSYLKLVASGSTTYDLSTASGAQNIAHGLGVAPRLVRITATHATTTFAAIATSAYSNSTQSSTYQAFFFGGAGTLSGTSFRVYTDTSGTVKYQDGVITVSSTNIVITWTKSSTPTGTAYIQWEAIA